jgi:hypothetical protein
MNRARPTQLKRERERAKKEKQQRKVERLADSRARRAAAPQSGLSRLDQEIAGIRPGPQPPPED